RLGRADGIPALADIPRAGLRADPAADHRRSPRDDPSTGSHTTARDARSGSPVTDPGRDSRGAARTPARTGAGRKTARGPTLRGRRVPPVARLYRPAALAAEVGGRAPSPDGSAPSPDGSASGIAGRSRLLPYTAVCVTLVGGTGDQLREKSRLQKDSHWPFS